MKDILIVDDEPSVVSSSTRALERGGVSCGSASSAAEAEEKLENGEYRTLLLDIGLPDRSGTDLLEEIKKRHPSVEVIILTGNATIETAVSCMKKGAYDFVKKPFDIHELRNTVKKALEKTKLKKRLNELEEIDRMKDVFLANVSHELRTPIQSIINSSEILLERDRESRTAGILMRNAMRLKKIVAQLLDYTRLEKGNYRLEPVISDISRTVSESVEEILPEADKKNITIDTILNAPGSHIYDPEAVKSAVLNLLSNAVKFTPEGGRVTASAEVSGNELMVSVSDTGPGIPDPEREKVFERFYQAEKGSSLDAKESGIGLGLSIVKGIAEAHGGRAFTLPSPSGCVFAFTIPLKSSD